MSNPVGGIWLPAVIAGALIIAVLAVVVFARDAGPVCPDGEQYRFTHNIIVGNVTVPQYACIPVVP